MPNKKSYKFLQYPFVFTMYIILFIACAGGLILVCFAKYEYSSTNQFGRGLLIVAMSLFTLFVVIVTLESSFVVEINEGTIRIKGYRGIIASCDIASISKLVIRYGSKGFAGIRLESNNKENCVCRKSLYNKKDGLYLYPTKYSESNKIIQILRAVLPDDIPWERQEFDPFERTPKHK